MPNVRVTAIQQHVRALELLRFLQATLPLTNLAQLLEWPGDVQALLLERY